jgi:hypothetical protein
MSVLSPKRTCAVHEEPADERQRIGRVRLQAVRRPRPHHRSKMAVNFIVVLGQQNAVVWPHERPFRLLLRISQSSE